MRGWLNAVDTAPARIHEHDDVWYSEQPSTSVSWGRAFVGRRQRWKNYESRTPLLDNVPVCRFIDGSRVTQSETIPDAKKGRMITQGSNLLVGSYHYFRSYTHPYLGRVNVDDGSVAYLELALAVVTNIGSPDELLWYKSPPAKKQKSDKERSHR